MTVLPVRHCSRGRRVAPRVQTLWRRRPSTEPPLRYSGRAVQSRRQLSRVSERIRQRADLPRTDPAVLLLDRALPQGVQWRLGPRDVRQLGVLLGRLGDRRRDSDNGHPRPGALERYPDRYSQTGGERRNEPRPPPPRARRGRDRRGAYQGPKERLATATARHMCHVCAALGRRQPALGQGCGGLGIETVAGRSEVLLRQGAEQVLERGIAIGRLRHRAVSDRVRRGIALM